jgi:hypothetical protein
VGEGTTSGGVPPEVKVAASARNSAPVNVHGTWQRLWHMVHRYLLRRASASAEASRSS